MFCARPDLIINLKHDLVLLDDKIDCDWFDGEIAPLYSVNGRPGIETRFVIGLLLLKHIYGLSDEGVCERWIYDPYFQHFTGAEFFQHEFPHERSGPKPLAQAARRKARTSAGRELTSAGRELAGGARER